MQVRPLCARCKRPVDALSETHDPFMQRVRLTAYCHGTSESVDLAESEAVNITLISAFNEPAELPALVSAPMVKP